MKLERIDFDHEEMPERIMFSVSLTEAALLYRLTGHSAPLFVTQAAGGDQKWGEANDDIAECLSGSLFNRFWDSGVDEVAPKFGVAEVAAREAEHDA